MIAFVRGVIASSTSVSSRLSVSGRMSTNTGVAPRSATAVARRRERERRHDHLVARLELEQQRHHLERRRRRVDEQRDLDADALLEPVRAEPRELSGRSELGARERVAHVLELGADGLRTVEGNALHGPPL